MFTFICRVFSYSEEEQAVGVPEGFEIYRIDPLPYTRKISENESEQDFERYQIVFVKKT